MSMNKLPLCRHRTSPISREPYKKPSDEPYCGTVPVCSGIQGIHLWLRLEVGCYIVTFPLSSRPEQGRDQSQFERMPCLSRTAKQRLPIPALGWWTMFFKPLSLLFFISMRFKTIPGRNFCTDCWKTRDFDFGRNRRQMKMWVGPGPRRLSGAHKKPIKTDLRPNLSDPIRKHAWPRHQIRWSD